MHSIKRQFDQQDFEIDASSQELLIKVSNKEEYGKDFENVKSLYAEDCNIPMLEAMLQAIPMLKREGEMRSSKIIKKGDIRFSIKMGMLTKKEDLVKRGGMLEFFYCIKYKADIAIL